MAEFPRPPRRYSQFTSRYPTLETAWKLIADAGADGPLTAREQRLIKLAIAIGAMREGSVHASVRKAVAMEIPREEIEQVIALAAGTLGMPSTVAVYSWVQDCMTREQGGGESENV